MCVYAYYETFLIAQQAKNMPAMWDTGNAGF